MYVNRSRHDSRTMAMYLSEESNYSDMLECGYFLVGEGGMGWDDGCGGFISVFQGGKIMCRLL